MFKPNVKLTQQDAASLVVAVRAMIKRRFMDGMPDRDPEMSELRTVLAKLRVIAGQSPPMSSPSRPAIAGPFKACND